MNNFIKPVEGPRLLSSERASPSLKVAVLIAHRPNHRGEVGGLVGTWERLSKVARGHPGLDLTLFFLGDTFQVIEQSENVRHVLLSPSLGTERLPFLSEVPTHTDLAPFHIGLFRRLRGFHVLHTTDTFYAFAKTALRIARIFNLPLVTSVQTDIIGWARIYTPLILRRILPVRCLANFVLNRYKLLDRQERSMEKRMGSYLRRCAGVFVSHRRDMERAKSLSPQTPVFFLRRGIDLNAFHPKRRDRRRLETHFGIPRDRQVMLFVGRMDPVKGVLVAAHVIRNLVRQGENVHLLAVGDGSLRREVAGILQDRATLPGNLPHEELGWIYASADMLIFPSEAEVWPNVVTEAMASGLPVVTCQKGASHLLFEVQDGAVLLPDRNPDEWSGTVRALLNNGSYRREMGRQARRILEVHGMSWRTILEEDLLPVWSDAAGSKTSAPFSVYGFR